MTANPAAEYLESTASTSTLPNDCAHGTARTNKTSVDQASVYHKVPGDSVSNRSSGAWGKGGKAARNHDTRHHMLTCTGTLPHLMPTGQDFFTQLKKQLASLDQTKPAQ